MNYCKKIIGILWITSMALFAFDGPVDYYGALNVSGSKILSAKTGLPVPLRGVSLGIATKAKPSADFFNATTISNLVDVWKAEVIRAPLEYTNLASYEADSAYYRKLFDNVIDACIAKNVYVIVDWRSSTLNTSVEEQGVALSFFLRIAKKYGSVPNVIFELFDRPESDEWTSVALYQQTLVTVIRSHSTNLILVGTPSYSQDVETIVDAPITGVNIAYSFHFYAGSQTPTSLSSNSKVFRAKIKTTLDAGYPVFISEFTTTHSDGGLASAAHYNTHDLSSSEKWLSFLDSNNLSYVAWQVNDEYVGSAFFGKEETPVFDQTVSANWGNTSLMTESGAYIYNKLQQYALIAPWRQAVSSSSSAVSSSSSLPVSSSSVMSSSSTGPLISIIDDFNDANNRAYTKEYWYIYTDVNDKGTSTVANPKVGTNYTAVFDDGDGNYAAAIQNFALKQGSNTGDPYVAIGLNTLENGTTYFLEQCVDGFSYRYKGVAHRFRVNISSVTDYNNHFKAMPAKVAWTKVIVPLSDLEQDPLWGEVVAFDPALIEGFNWEVKKTPTSGSLWVDDFQCLGANLGLVSSSSSVPLSSSTVASSSSAVPTSSSSVTSSSSSGPLMSIIDDFNDGNNLAYNKEYWYVYTDVNDKGASTVANPKVGANYTAVFDDGTGNYAAALQSFILKQGTNPDDAYVAIGLNTVKNGSTYFLNQCVDGFSYRYKGAAHRFRVNISSVTDYNNHFKIMPAKTPWTTVVVPFSDLAQDPAWGKTVVFNAALIKSFNWEVKKAPTSGSLWIDDFKCLGADLGLVPSSSSVLASSSSSTTTIASVSFPSVKVQITANERYLSITPKGLEVVSVEIFDMIGRPVISAKQLTSNNHRLSLESLPSGSYLARVRVGKNAFSVQLRIP